MLSYSAGDLDIPNQGRGDSNSSTSSLQIMLAITPLSPNSAGY